MNGDGSERHGLNDAAYMIRKLDARVRQLEVQVNDLLSDRRANAETYPSQGDRCTQKPPNE